MESQNLLIRQEKFVQSAFTKGRTVGILLLLQLAAALTLPFILAKPINMGSPAFLIAVSEHSLQIRTAIFLSFVGAALTVYLGIVASQVFRIFSTSAALLFLVVCAVSCTLDIIHAGHIMSMLAISNEFVSSGSVEPGLYKVIGAAVASARRSAHASQLLAIGAWMFVFYITLFRFKLVPRILASLGFVGITLQFTGVTLMMFIGHNLISELARPLLPIQIIVAVWLIIKGFNDPALKASNLSEIR
jgi:hypothetical protein